MKKHWCMIGTQQISQLTCNCFYLMTHKKVFLTFIALSKCLSVTCAILNHVSRDKQIKMDKPG